MIEDTFFGNADRSLYYFYYALSFILFLIIVKMTRDGSVADLIFVTASFYGVSLLKDLIFHSILEEAISDKNWAYSMKRLPSNMGRF